MIKLQFIKATELDRNIKCTIHKNGKLGFSETAIKKLSVDKTKSVKIAVNEGDSNDTTLYMQIVDGTPEDAFKINKAGQYFYVNTKPLFDKLKIDYSEQSIIYDITDFEYEGNKLYKLTKREMLKKTSN